MSPQLLAEYLEVLKAAGVLSAGLEIPLQYDDHTEVVKMSVQFLPEVEPLPIPPTEPGGWKRSDLDRGYEDNQ